MAALVRPCPIATTRYRALGWPMAQVLRASRIPSPGLIATPRHCSAGPATAAVSTAAPIRSVASRADREAARPARHRPERRPVTSRHARRRNGRSAASRAVRREADDVRRKAPLTWRPTRVLPDEGVVHYRLDGPRNFGDNRGEHGHQYPRPRGLHHGADPRLGVRLAPWSAGADVGGQRPVVGWVGAVWSTIAPTIVSQSARSTP